MNLVEETPIIQINQNHQVNVNILDSFDRDSKERVMEALKSILENSAKEPQEVDDYIELKEEVEDE